MISVIGTALTWAGLAIGAIFATFVNALANVTVIVLVTMLTEATLKPSTSVTLPAPSVVIRAHALQMFLGVTWLVIATSLFGFTTPERSRSPFRRTTAFLRVVAVAALRAPKVPPTPFEPPPV